MKILYLHQYFATRESATGTRSYEFAKALKKQGHEVEILTGSSQLESFTKEQTTVFGKYEIDGLVVNVINNKYKNSFGKWQRIWAFLTFLIIACFFQMKKREFDVIYATSTPLTIGIPAMFLSWKGKVPFVFEVRDLWPEAPYQLGFIKSPFIYKSLCILETQIYKKAKHVVALSPGMKEGIMSKKIPERKITVIPNSADLELFKTQSTGKYRNLFNLGDKFVLAHIGSMGVINGLDYLIEAARKLKDCDEKEVVILIVGEGAKKVELKSLVNRYELDNVYIMDSLPKHEIPTLMADVDATIMSVKHHPVLEMASPNKFFDSLAAGKPVLVNCEGWMKELVEKHEIGMFVRVDHPYDVVMAIHQLKANRKVLEYGKNARQLAEKSFSRHDLSLKLEKILEDVRKVVL